MKPIRIPTLSSEQLNALEELYRTTREPRLRTRPQVVLLAAEQHLSAATIAQLVGVGEETVRPASSSATWPRGRGIARRVSSGRSCLSGASRTG